MVTLEERLRSRFEWGLMADISPPDLETRMAILQHKAAQMGRELPMEVVEFVARQIQSNVRELEGALTRLLATADITGRPITVQLARDALSDLTGRRVNITPSQVIETVAAYYNISVAEMVSPSRNKELVQPRQVAIPPSPGNRRLTPGDRRVARRPRSHHSAPRRRAYPHAPRSRRAAAARHHAHSRAPLSQHAALLSNQLKPEATGQFAARAQNPSRSNHQRRVW